ncbi:MAG: type II toxin-antitoxin system PemK/MazF family toxin [Deltaproteobacteria bacterium]|nr:type II toxin-antitoxin system PemK/MazF family toxin [Candidatus Anaeroferrophillacea bacterium]
MESRGGGRGVVPPSEKSVVLVKFPFSDLSSTKLRPAVVLTYAGRDDWILCQITSNPYADLNSIMITDDDFNIGSLQRLSYARPTKLFTTNNTLIDSQVGKLNDVLFNKIINAIIEILHRATITK